MTAYRVDPKNMGKWAAALGRRLQPVVRRALQAGGRAALPILRDATARYPIRATGAFMRGWRAEMSSWDKLYLRNIAPHSIFVEMGRRPGARQPPVMALIPWVRLVLGVPEERERSVAFAVARAIARRGIQARPVLMSEQTRARANRVVQQRLAADLSAEVAKQVAAEAKR